MVFKEMVNVIKKAIADVPPNTRVVLDTGAGSYMEVSRLAGVGDPVELLVITGTRTRAKRKKREHLESNLTMFPIWDEMPV